MMFLSDHIIASASFLKVSFFTARLRSLALLPADTISRTKEGKIQHGATSDTFHCAAVSLTLLHILGKQTSRQGPLPSHSPSPISRLDESEQAHR